VLGCAVLADFFEDILAGGFRLLHPRVLGGQHHLGLREVGCRAAQLHHQFEQTLDGGQDLQILLLAVQIFLRDAQVLELADGVIRRQRLGELLQRIQPGVPVFGFFLAQQVLAPEAELALPYLPHGGPRQRGVYRRRQAQPGRDCRDARRARSGLPE